MILCCTRTFSYKYSVLSILPFYPPILPLTIVPFVRIEMLVSTRVSIDTHDFTYPNNTVNKRAKNGSTISLKTEKQMANKYVK